MGNCGQDRFTFWGNIIVKIEFYQQRVSLDPEQEPDHIIILISLAKLTVGPIHVLLYNYHVKYVLGISKMSWNTQQIKNIPCQYKIIGVCISLSVEVEVWGCVWWWGSVAD